MKAYLQTLCADADSPIAARHLIREYLQARILQSLQRAGAMQSLAFHGGTALRFLYGIPRYSEDLDFALERSPNAYDFRTYLRQIEHDFLAEAYTLDFKVNDKPVVHKAFIRFQGLLHELGLSPRDSEILAIKLEVDTNPPAGAILATTALKSHVALNIQHHDPTSLFAGKLLAVLLRNYSKGRDFFDLWWYLSQSDWPLPNFEMINHGLFEQSEWSGPQLDETNWRHYVRERVNPLNWQRDVLQDVQAFMIDTIESESLSKESILRLIEPQLHK